MEDKLHMHNKVKELLRKHLDEAEAYSVSDTAPSALRRGEGTPKDYYILKVDLVGSTKFVIRKQHVTYLRLAHTFLSTIDEITQRYGAESNQVEYAGDGIIAYFPCDKIDAIDVLRAAYYCRYAALQMKGMHPTFGSYEFKTKIMLHKAQLLVTKIGPWGDFRVTAIGHGLHLVCKMESDVPAGEGRASISFKEAMERKYMRFLLGEYYEESTIPSAQPSSVPATTSMGFGEMLSYVKRTNPERTLLGGSAIEHIWDDSPRRGLNALAKALYGNSSQVTTPSPSPVPEMKRTLLRHRIAWKALEMFELGRLKI